MRRGSAASGLFSGTNTKWRAWISTHPWMRLPGRSNRAIVPPTYAALLHAESGGGRLSGQQNEQRRCRHAFHDTLRVSTDGVTEHVTGMSSSSRSSAASSASRRTDSPSRRAEARKLAFCRTSVTAAAIAFGLRRALEGDAGAALR